MKILQLSKKNPFPAVDGESIAVQSLSGTFAKMGVDISLLIISTPKHRFDAAKIPASANFYRQTTSAEVDTDVKPLGAFLNLFSRESYNISRFDAPNFREKLITILKSESFDIIQLETLYLTPYLATIRQYSSAKIILRSHNIEYEIWERVSHQQAWGLKKIYLRLLTSRLKSYELSHVNKYDMIWAISDRDRQQYIDAGCTIPIHTVPIGIDINKYVPIEHFQAKIGFIGSLDWLPNIEGVEWLLEDTWKRVMQVLPTANLYIAGRNTPESLKQQAPKGVHIFGEVPDAVDFLRNYAPIMVVPLLSGGGMRVKILEAMAMGCCVITTSIGLEGIAAEHQKEVLIADSSQAIADTIIYCLNNLAKAAEIGKNARLFIARTFDNQSIAQKALATIATI